MPYPSSYINGVPPGTWYPASTSYGLPSTTNKTPLPLWKYLFNCDAGTVTISGYFTNEILGQVGAEWTGTVTSGSPINFQQLYAQSSSLAIDFNTCTGFEGNITINNDGATRLYYAKNNTYVDNVITNGNITNWSYLPYYGFGDNIRMIFANQ